MIYDGRRMVPNSEQFDFNHNIRNIITMFIRKLGPNPTASLCVGGRNCPAIFEMESGDYAIVGADITETAIASLPKESGCGSHERVVRVPREVLVLARGDIPSRV